MSEPTTYAGVTHGPLTTTPYTGPTLEPDNLNYTTEKAQTHDAIWSVRELRILGGFLWVMVIITLVGNFSCFYAVWKNLKKILEHPFFQSNVFCVLLSVADVLLVLLVGIPAAVFFSTCSTSLGNSLYNRAVVEPILDYLVWLQLFVVVAICLDRAGHICRPLTYTFSIKARRTTVACLLCVTVPFLLLTVPYIKMADKTIKETAADVAGHPDLEEANDYIMRNSFKCKGFAYDNGTDTKSQVFMSCTLQLPREERWPAGKVFQWWENISHPLVLMAAVLSLLISNGLIIRKLIESAAFQKNNVKRQEEVTKSIRMNSIVSTVQAVLLLICTLPMRVYQMERRFETWEDCDTTVRLEDGSVDSCIFNSLKYTHHYVIITKVLVFLGPMINPWLYPIRMASIRSFLATKKRSVVSSARRFTVSSRTKSEYRQKRHKNEYVTLETEDRGNNAEPEQSKSYSRL
ncbi:hypothetical protein ACHWQZ_G010243 [Mnemiopsis leidyi]